MDTVPIGVRPSAPERPGFDILPVGSPRDMFLDFVDALFASESELIRAEALVQLKRVKPWQLRTLTDYLHTLPTAQRMAELVRIADGEGRIEGPVDRARSGASRIASQARSEAGIDVASHAHGRAWVAPDEAHRFAS